jgi:hypothetical protein
MAFNRVRAVCDDLYKRAAVESVAWSTIESAHGLHTAPQARPRRPRVRGTPRAGSRAGPLAHGIAT